MNYLSQKRLPRRTFLQGAGAVVGLPFLDAMTPALSAAPADRTRLICIEEVHGLAGCNSWGAERFLFAPETTGRDYELVPDNPLAALERWRDAFTIVSNTDVRMAEAFSPSEVGGDHFRSSAVFLTQAHPKQTQGSDITCGTSLDQLHAQRFGQQTPLPSLQLSIEPTDKGGGCDYNYSCSYTDCISWSAPNEPMPMIRNPRTVFDLLFGAGGTAKGRAERRRTQASILDWVVGEVASMNTQLGAADRRRIDQYLSSVREVERRIQMTEAANDRGEPRALPDAPAGIPDSYSEHLKILFDLEVLAFESDITRIVSLKTGRDASNRTFPESGSDRAFHPASHHGDKESGILEFNRICQYRVAQLGYLLERLQATHDRGVPLLEQTAILWGSPMGDANLHNHKRCPLVIFGGANGRLTHGRHIKAPDATPMANAMLALMNRLGHERESFGDSTGELAI